MPGKEDPPGFGYERTVSELRGPCRRFPNVKAGRGHLDGGPGAPAVARAPVGSVTAVIPCYNEEPQVAAVYHQVSEELGRYGDVELLFVDDGSVDGTLDRIRELAAADPLVKYISFTRNFGQEAAFSAAFKYASKQWIVQFDADLQSPPAEAHKLLAKAAEGYDAVFALRVGRQDRWLRRAGSSAQQWFARRVLGIELHQGASAFRALRASVAKKVVALRMGHPYFIATLPLVGARTAMVPTEHHPRRGGGSRWGLGRLVGHSFELFFGYSLVPLAWLYLVALAGSAAAGLTVALAVAGVADATGLGIASQASAMATFAILAVLARYVQRLLAEHRRPRQFYVREANLPVAPEDHLYEHELRRGEPPRRLAAAPRTPAVPAARRAREADRA